MITLNSASLMCALCLYVFSPFTLAMPQFINEFHYDNSGADTQEYVEIAGLAGSDLTGWRLDFYNGTNGRIYDSWGLSGVIDDEAAGWGALSFSGGGLQNGSKDGIALVDNLGALVQFISYEGVLTGTEGAALGITSIDVGVSETSATPAGTSLQLSGSGTGWQDFSWTSQASSFGELNASQFFSALPPPLKPVLHSVAEPHALALLLLGFAGLRVSRLKRLRYHFS